MQAKSCPKVRRAVLGLVLYEHPDPMTVDGLKREVGEDAAQAVSDLVAAGLLWRDEDAVRPTRAAVHFDQLAP
jgi:hypothetical protein